MSINYDLPTLKQKIATLPENMKEWAFEVLMQQAQLMRDLAQTYVLVDTGSLRDSIRVERGGKSLHWQQVSVRAGGYIVNPRTGRLVDYAVFVEAKESFMRRAWEQVKPAISEMIKAKVVQAANE